MKTVSRRLSKKVLEKLVRFEGILKQKTGTPISQRELLDKAIEFAIDERKEEFTQYLAQQVEIPLSLEEDPAYLLLMNPIEGKTTTDVSHEAEVDKVVYG